MQKRVLFFLSLIAGACIIAISSCNEEPTLFGLDLLPTRDKESVFYNDAGTLAGNIFSIDSIAGYRAVKPFLGSMNDLVFGVTEGSVAVQFLYTVSNKSFGSSPVADSLILYIKVDTAYGDTTTPQMLRIYPLTERLYADSVYFSNKSMEGLYDPNEIGSVSFVPTDTLIKIRMDNALGQSLLSADSATKSDPNTFLNYFKGIYIKPEKVTTPGKGALIRADLFATQTYLKLYYHNDTTDSLTADYDVNSTFSARLGLLKHDYSATGITGINDTLRNDSVLYVQSLSGLGVHLSFPCLESWKDSLPVAIHKAELFLYPDPVQSESYFARPSKLDAYIKTSSGNFGTIADASLSTSSGTTTYDFLGGSYNETFKAYHFTLTYHFQRYLQGKSERTDIYVFPSNQGSEVTGLVLRNGTNIRFRLKITYSRY
ncbi:MAG: DUF4270 family protein [Bacteroidales bacterium]